MILSIVATKTNISYKEQEIRLRKKYKEIGSGRDAEIYKVSSNRVIKLHRMFTGTHHNDPYWNFLRIMPENNIYFPRIFDIKLYRFKSLDRVEEYTIIKMEHLIKLNDFSNRGQVLRAAIQDFGFPKCAEDKFISRLANWALGWKRKQKNMQLNPQTQMAMDVLDTLKSLSCGDPDLHEGNFMVRKKEHSQLVIIDPMA